MVHKSMHTPRAPDACGVATFPIRRLRFAGKPDLMEIWWSTAFTWPGRAGTLFRCLASDGPNHPMREGTGLANAATEGGARTPRTASREVRRQQLIQATIESIAKHGISGTTMNTVTKQAGLSIGIVNFHFESKENLLEETLRHLAEEHRHQWKSSVEKAGPSPRDRLLAIVDAEFHPKICSRKKLTVWFAFYGEAGYRKSYRKIMSSLDNERWEASHAICAELIRDGGYDHLDAEDVAETIEGLFDGFCMSILIYPGEFTRDVARAKVRSYLATAFPRHFDRPAKTCGKN